ncbi:MAG: AMP-binding protein [Cyclobacteriaceae bacterium]|nr:AMP-binding protein [Cyclobacteriaceae bacterium]
MNKKIINLAKSDNNNNWQTAISFYEEWQHNITQFELTTSGSTGKPKPISITRAQMEASALQTIAFLKLLPSYHLLICINTNYIGGKMMLVRGLLNNMSIYVTEPSSNPLKNIHLPIDFMAIVPMQLQTMLQEREHEKLNKIKAIIVGGAVINPFLEKQIEQLQVPIYATYGMTETVSHIALKPMNGKEKSNYFTTLGDVKIALDDRNCLTITGSVTNHTTIVTNDIVKLISDNQFEWLGRFDNIINSGGIKINPEQIENRIAQLFLEHQIHQRFFMYGIDDELLGQKAVLMIEGVKLETIDLLQLLTRHLDKYQCPKSILYVDRFAETETGKIKRKETISNFAQN